MFAQLLLVAGGSLLLMQSTADYETELKPQRAVPNVKHDVKSILDEWQRREPKIHRGFVRLRVHEYDTVFCTDKRSWLTLQFEPRSRFLIRHIPIEVGNNEVSNLKRPDGQPFQVVSCEPATWYLDRHSVTQFQDSTKTYSFAQFPPQRSMERLRYLFRTGEPKLAQSWSESTVTESSIADLLVALATGMHVDELRSRPTWSVRPKPEENEIHLSAVLPANAQHSIQGFDITIDSRTYQTISFQLIHPFETRRTVYLLKEKHVDAAAPEFTSPDIRNYQPISEYVENLKLRFEDFRLPPSSD